jgi:hypothetical protein
MGNVLLVDGDINFAGAPGKQIRSAGYIVQSIADSDKERAT